MSNKTILVQNRSKTANVKIYALPRKSGAIDFKVADYSTGQRRLLSFSDEAEARAKATEIVNALAKGEAIGLTLRGRDRLAYIRALEILRPTGTTLEAAAMHYAEAVGVLGGDRVLEAARYFAKRHPESLPSKLVKDVVAEMIADRAAQGKSSLYLADLNHRLGRFANAFSMPIAAVIAPDVRAWLASLKLSARSSDNFLGAVRTLFSFAKERRYLPKDHDELDSLKCIDEADGEIEIFTPAEMSTLLCSASEAFQPCLAIAAFSGVRSAEIERLQWSDVSLGNGDPFIRITADNAKTGSRRIVPVASNLARWLAGSPVQPGPIWPHGHAYFYEQMRETAKAAKVPWKRNGLRHSFISYRLAEIKDAARVALEAGNSPKMIFQHYNQLVTAQEAATWFSIVPPS